MNGKGLINGNESCLYHMCKWMNESCLMRHVPHMCEWVSGLHLKCHVPHKYSMRVDEWVMSDTSSCATYMLYVWMGGWVASEMWCATCIFYVCRIYTLCVIEWVGDISDMSCATYPTHDMSCATYIFYAWTGELVMSDVSCATSRMNGSCLIYRWSTVHQTSWWRFSATRYVCVCTMCVCVYAHTGVCVYIHIPVCVCVCIYIPVMRYVCVCMRTHTGVCVCIHIPVCVCVCIHIPGTHCVCVWTMCVCMYTHTSMCVCVYIYIPETHCVCVCVYTMCVCMHTHTWVCEYIHAPVCMCVRIEITVFLYIYIRIPVWVYIHTCRCVFVFVHTNRGHGMRVCLTLLIHMSRINVLQESFTTYRCVWEVPLYACDMTH